MHQAEVYCGLWESNRKKEFSAAQTFSPKKYKYIIKCSCEILNSSPRKSLQYSIRLFSGKHPPNRNTSTTYPAVYRHPNTLNKFNYIYYNYFYFYYLKKTRPKLTIVRPRPVYTITQVYFYDLLHCIHVLYIFMDLIQYFLVWLFNLDNCLNRFLRFQQLCAELWPISGPRLLQYSVQSFCSL